MAQYKLRTETVPPIGIYRLLWYVIVPLMVSAVLSCWLFSIDPIDRKGDVVVQDGIITDSVPDAKVFLPDASNFVTRLHALGYKVLIAPVDPPEFLADLAPGGEPDGKSYNQNALKGWEQGRFYLWPALFVAGFFSIMHGVSHSLVNWSNLARLLARRGFCEE